MTGSPKVSVIVPCYNAEEHIGATIESVLRQTWAELEVIVIDDGSQDDSILEVQRFSDQRVQLFRQQNAGAGAARNGGYRRSSGQFIQFLDADDLIDADKIERQIIRLLERPGCVASAEWGRFYDSPEETKFEPEAVWQDLLPLDWIAGCRADGLGMMFPAIWLIPRSIADAAGPWDESLSLGDDGEYFTRVVLAAEKVLFCPAARCRYRSGLKSSLSGRKSPDAWRSQFRVIELCESWVRSREDSERVRRGFALAWQHLAHACYPYDHTLADVALARARGLHPARIQPGGGFAFRAISKALGWRIARRLQVASGRP